MSLVALMTDFGTRDYYVAAMKGMIYQINPKATVVDVTHDIPAQNLFHAAFTLRQVLPYYPPATIFVAVVDPGVGSSRRIIAGRYHDRIVLAPDNGLITLVHRDAELQEMRVVENRRLFASTLSSTFHGRDIFAPVAGHLSRGVSMAEVGPPADRLEILDWPKPVIRPDGSIQGRIVLVDTFGNLISNISERDIATIRTPRHGAPQVAVESHAVGALRNTYSDVTPGEVLALIGSSGLLEVAVNTGSAATRLSLGVGATVQVH